MASLTIRNLNETTKAQLRLIAASNGHSMEQEARLILSNAVNKANAPAEQNLVQRIEKRFAGVDTKDFTVPQRTPAPPALKFK